MIPRILTAAVLIPAVVALVWFGPPALVAAMAAVVGILALIEFFDLGERVGLRAIRKWTIACAAGLFYGQYCVGLIETHSLGEGISLVRNTAAVSSLSRAVYTASTFWAVGAITTAPRFTS